MFRWKKTLKYDIIARFLFISSQTQLSVPTVTAVMALSNLKAQIKKVLYRLEHATNINVFILKYVAKLDKIHCTIKSQNAVKTFRSRDYRIKTSHSRVSWTTYSITEWVHSGRLFFLWIRHLIGRKSRLEIDNDTYPL